MQITLLMWITLREYLVSGILQIRIANSCRKQLVKLHAGGGKQKKTGPLFTYEGLISGERDFFEIQEESVLCVIL